MEIPQLEYKNREKICRIPLTEEEIKFLQWKWEREEQFKEQFQQKTEKIKNKKTTT